MLRLYERKNVPNAEDVIFDICIIVGNDFSGLDAFIERHSNESVMIYSTSTNFEKLEDKVESLWRIIPSLELSTKTFPISFSHISLARSICVYPDVGDEDINEILSYLYHFCQIEFKFFQLV